MTAVDWTSQPPPWQWVGPDFADECRGIVSGVPAPPPRTTSPLQAARKRRGMRQKQVAGILGISQVHLGKLERGDRRIDVARPALRARIQAFIDG